MKLINVCVLHSPACIVTQYRMTALTFYFKQMKTVVTDKYRAEQVVWSTGYKKGSHPCLCVQMCVFVFVCVSVRRTSICFHSLRYGCALVSACVYVSALTSTCMCTWCNCFKQMEVWYKTILQNWWRKWIPASTLIPQDRKNHKGKRAPQLQRESLFLPLHLHLHTDFSSS